MKMKKPVTLLAAALFLIAVLFSFILAFADDISWQYNSTSKTLYITGSGNMDDYENPVDGPWVEYITEVETVVIGEGVTSIGKNAFCGANHLTEVTVADSVTTIGATAFASCPMLNSLTLGDNVISIADESFAYNGSTLKSQFVMNVPAGSYALYFAYNRQISFVSEDVKTGTLHVSLQKGMTAYFPYTCYYTGQYQFYSVSKHDSIGYIYDNNRTQVAYNDDHASAYDSNMGSTDFGITKTLTKGERYFLAVKVFNPSLKANFDVYFKPVSFTVSGSIYAMNSPNGDASDILLNNAAIDGVATDNGSFTKTVNGVSETVSITCDGVTKEHTFTVEDGDEIVITMMMCDVNGDGIVNAKDFALMQQSNSRYLSLFENFMNYRY